MKTHRNQVSRPLNARIISTTTSPQKPSPKKEKTTKQNKSTHQTMQKSEKKSTPQPMFRSGSSGIGDRTKPKYAKEMIRSPSEDQTAGSKIAPPRPLHDPSTTPPGPLQIPDPPHPRLIPN